MYLQRIQLNGFKSFVNKTKIELDSGITCIVGPNGTGKSNIVDAVRWVLGEQSAKSLRGDKMEDVIFSGSKDKKPLGRAEVSITLNNNDNKFPLDYSEITVTRRIYKSGESQYLINNIPCRLRDVQELFMDTGIGRETFAIIGQGKVDWVINSTPENRRPLFEEAAGVTKYKYRKKEALRKLEKTKEDLNRINDILHEIKAQLTPLDTQAKEAEEYLQKKDELNSLEKQLYLSSYHSKKEKLEKIFGKIEDLNLHIKNLYSNENRVHKLVARYSTSTKLIEDRINNFTDEIEKISDSKEEHKGKKMVLEEQKINLENQLNIKIKDREGYFESFKKLDSELNIKYVKLQNTIKAFDKLNFKANSLEARIEELNRILNKNEKAVSNLSDEKIDYLSTMTSLETDLENCKREINVIETQIFKNQQECENKNTYLQEVNDKLNKSSAKKSTLESNLSEVTKRLKNKTTEIRNIEKKLESIKKEKTNQESQVNEISSHYKVLNEMQEKYEGYYKGVKSVLIGKNAGNRECSGIIGVIAEIIDVKEEYEVALESALGSSLQYLVAYTDEDVKKAISFLKNNSSGRAAFLPLNTLGIEKHNILECIKGHKGVVGIASELVSCDENFKSAVDYLLGKTVIVKDLDSAVSLSKQIKHNCKIVTLDGDVFNVGGSIFGGEKRKFSKQSVLGRSKKLQELEKSLKKEKDKYNTILKEEGELIGEQKQANSKLEKLSKGKEALSAKINMINQGIEVLNLRQQDIERSLEVYNLEKKQLQKELDTLKDKQIKLRYQLNENKIKAHSYDKMLACLKSQIKSYKKERDYKTNVLAKIKIKLSALNEQKKNITFTVNDLKERLNDINEQLSQIDNYIDNSKYNKQNLAEEIKTAEDNIAFYNDKINLYKGKKEKYKKGFEKVKNRIQFYEGELNSIYNEVKRKENRKNNFEIDKAKLETEIEGLYLKLTEELELSEDEMIYVVLFKEDVEKINERISFLRKEIQDFGEVNIGAIKQYKELKKRHDFLVDQKEDLLKASVELRQVITQTDNIMQKKFSEVFSEINNHFSVVFSKLFAGGRACLNLTDKDSILDSGVIIEAQPPDKKMQNISLLSGGERALTAIALLFSFLKVNPAPFCVLDEIEVSLDETNAINFATFLREFSENIQFLVITHRQHLLEQANIIYGVTMENPGVSKFVSIKLDEENQLTGSA